MSKTLANLLSTTPGGTLVLNGHPLVMSFVDIAGVEHTLRATVDDSGEWIEFAGSPTGEHRLCADGRITNADRVYAHWTGYVSNSVAAADRAVVLLAARAQAEIAS